jgi:hypothetical protein
MGNCTGTTRGESGNNNIFTQLVETYVIKEEPNGQIPASEVARLTLSRGLHAYFSSKSVLEKIWENYSQLNGESDLRTLNYIQLQTLICDVLCADKEKDRILHERHMTGDLKTTTASSDDVTNRLRRSKGKFHGYLDLRNTKIEKILDDDARIEQVAKKIFKQLDGHLENKRGGTVKPEISVTERTFLSRFRLDVVLDLIKV